LEWEVLHEPAYTALRLRLEPGEAVLAEPGAYLLSQGELQVETTSLGLGAGLKRALLGGESFFLNKFRAVSRSELWLVPAYPGDVKYLRVSPGETFYVQDGSFLAMHGDVRLGVAWRGVRGLIAQGELFWLKLEGSGGAWVSSYGAIVEKELGAGERLRADNYHIVAMTDVKWRITKIGGLKTFFFGGEGFIIEAEGPGKVYIQTRSLPALARVIGELTPSRR